MFDLISIFADVSLSSIRFPYSLHGESLHVDACGCDPDPRSKRSVG